jgi:hypothetical protein
MEAQQSQAGKNFKTDSKRAAVELWRAGLTLATIRKQLKDNGVYSEEDFAHRQEEPHLAGGGGGLPAEPGGGADDKVSGGDCQGGWHDQILN